MRRNKGAFHSRRTSSGLEFSAAISRWKESEGGDYIEYIIEFSDYVGDNRWEVTKRYSDFVYIHYQILNSKHDKMHELPPKIDGKRVGQLNLRMQQLENYLNKYLSEYPINPKILEFWEFKKPDSEIFRNLINMHIKEIICEINGRYWEMRTSGTVETLFEAGIEIIPFDESKEQLNIKVQISYPRLEKFNKDLLQIATMGDINITNIGELPKRIKEDGTVLRDQEMMEVVQDYFETIQRNHSIVNLFLFKRFIMDIQIEENYDRSNSEQMNLFGSIKGEEAIFENINKNLDTENDDYDDDQFN